MRIQLCYSRDVPASAREAFTNWLAAESHGQCMVVDCETLEFLSTAHGAIAPIWLSQYSKWFTVIP